ncbi:deoxyuridine 5'-triphosphate nucleotidohydrolase, mitochondrial isoform X1 [Gopherus evgoodei]|uniref:deoxyuridine 5'-triphosphate nucleotidohydrolase, mitochondrial isoform X1 n=1 Tax=Gopherus evgoodei TaxID=1825980 RepID=UPI0011CF3840|nr:deoxyuridine 5'-triphosphate nucleotidohydrolase, mitochondrial isoform X1 [Gopherus evgoodei]
MAGLRCCRPGGRRRWHNAQLWGCTGREDSRALVLHGRVVAMGGGGGGCRVVGRWQGSGAAGPDPAVSPSKRLKAAEPDLRLRFAKLSENASAPSRGSARAAGYDLYSAYDYVIPAMEKAIVKTDIQISLPSGCYGRVAPRSGLAAKHFIDVGAGVIDEDYRGNVGVVLFNFGKEDFEVKKGDRIAQLICERIFYPELEEVQVLDDTERGTGGFGSTGQN